MPTSDADLDQQLRAAMKTLDDEVPSGYFEALPDLTLARLEGSTMQHGTQGTTENASAAPPAAATNTEDSGLHDIRNLAQSTKQRLSSRRIGTSPPVSEDDLIASSSAGFKAVALPQPAKMVALPELTELPSKKEVLAKEKAAAKAEKAAAKVAPVEAAAPVAAAAPAVEARQPSFSLPSAQPKKSKKGVIAIVGIGLAAAAGAAIFVTTQKKDSASNPAPALAQNTAAPAAAPVVTPIGGAGAGSAAVSADVQKAQEEVARAEADAEKAKQELAATQTGAGADSGAAKPADVPKTPTKAVKGHGKEKVDTTPTQKVDETKATDKGKDTTKKDAPKTGSGGEAEPDFNDLLKEAGVKEPEKKKPVLDKKELSGDDFKKGMAAVTSKAQGCYKGTQGTATVKMTIAPSGQIAKVTVSGQFATTPEGACVVNAVKAATFPAWDGHPASFTYPILLSE